MAIKQFAIPLNGNSQQSGDITFEQLAGNNTAVRFRLSNVMAGSSNELNLVTSNSGALANHTFPATMSNGDAVVDLTANQVAAIFSEAGDDRDYVEAYWTVGAVDTPGNSSHCEIQSGHIYNTHFWPPKPKR